MALSYPVHTERLSLRPYRSTDVDASLAYYADPDVARYLLDEPWTREYAERQVTKRVGRTTIDAPGSALALVVEREGQVVGDLALWPPDATLSRGEIGWVFHPQAAGQGFATEAVRAVLDLAFGHFRMHRVAAQMDARNSASARLAERLGMTREAHLRRDWWSKGEWTDTFIYGLLAEEWRGQGSDFLT